VRYKNKHFLKGEKMIRIANSMLAITIVFVLLVFCGVAFDSKITEPISSHIPSTINKLDEQQEICLNMLHGIIVYTGNPWDLAIEGDGYIVLSDGQQDVLYSRGRSFGVDENSMLFDPGTGYCVQRIGSTGEEDGFQIPGDSNIFLPYDVPLPGKATSTITVQGNLSANAIFPTPLTQKLTSNIRYTTGGNITAIGTTEIDQLDQYSGTLTSGTITISGYNKDGAILSSGLTFNIDGTTTLQDFIDHLNNNTLTDSTASLVNGKIVLTDATSGYSETDITLSYSGDGTLTMPAYFKLAIVSGEQVKNINITVYDSLGGTHVLSGAFVRTNTPNTWDMVLTSITGDITQITMDDRRIRGIEFNPFDGSYSGLNAAIGDSAEFKITFENMSEQTITISMGTVGQYDGLTQLAGNSTAVARSQDGYGQGSLTSVSVNNAGIIVGTFSNGVECDIATIEMAMFENVCGLLSIGGGYFLSTDDSGEAIATQAMSNGAGAIHDKALEKPIEPTTNIENAIDKKLEALEKIDAALEKEWTMYYTLGQILESGDFGNLKKADIVKAKQKVHSAIQHQEQAIDALEKSIEKLEDALTALRAEPPADEITEE